MQIITAPTFEKARNLLKTAKHPIVFTSNDDELNRKILEKEKIDVFLISLAGRKDWQKQRNSGLDTVMAREATKNKVVIAINLDEIISSQGKEKAEILSRIKQNIKLCSKYKVKMTFLPKKEDSYDLKSLGLILGMPTWMTKGL